MCCVYSVSYTSHKWFPPPLLVVHLLYFHLIESPLQRFARLKAEMAQLSADLDVMNEVKEMRWDEKTTDVDCHWLTAAEYSLWCQYCAVLCCADHLSTIRCATHESAPETLVQHHLSASTPPPACTVNYSTCWPLTDDSLPFVTCVGSRGYWQEEQSRSDSLAHPANGDHQHAQPTLHPRGAMQRALWGTECMHAPRLFWQWSAVCSAVQCYVGFWCGVIDVMWGDVMRSEWEDKNDLHSSDHCLLAAHCLSSSVCSIPCLAVLFHLYW